MVMVEDDKRETGRTIRLTDELLAGESSSDPHPVDLPRLLRPKCPKFESQVNRLEHWPCEPSEGWPYWTGRY